jgi:hypothetical protein
MAFCNSRLPRRIRTPPRMAVLHMPSQPSLLSLSERQSRCCVRSSLSSSPCDLGQLLYTTAVAFSCLSNQTNVIVSASVCLHAHTDAIRRVGSIRANDSREPCITYAESDIPQTLLSKSGTILSRLELQPQPGATQPLHSLVDGTSVHPIAP